MQKPTHGPNRWKTLSQKTVYENPWLALSEREVINPGGGHNQYGVVQFKNYAIGIVPLDENDHTWLVGQWRYSLGEYSWEIPMGGGPLEADILDSAKRELQEETGLLAQEWELVMRMHTSNSVTDETGFAFVARDLQEGPSQPEETEDLLVWKLPLFEAVAMVMRGEITDSLSVAALLKIGRILEV